MSMFALLGPDSPFGTSMPESARVRIDATGKIIGEVTFPWEGQGQHTFAANFLADYFGIKREDVEVIAVDSLSAGPGTGPIGSRQAVMLSGALLGAAERIAEKLRKVAGVILEANADDVELFNGQLRVKGSPEKTLPLQRSSPYADALGSLRRADGILKRVPTTARSKWPDAEGRRQLRLPRPTHSCGWSKWTGRPDRCVFKYVIAMTAV